MGDTKTTSKREPGKGRNVGAAGKTLAGSSKRGRRTAPGAGKSFSGMGRLKLTGNSAAATVRKLERGFSSKALSELKNALDLSWSDLAELLQVRPRTLNRRRGQRRLPTDESERVLRISRVYNGAVELFEGDVEAARHWLKQPRKSLGHQSPLWFAKTEPGAREVEELIGRLEHGVFT